MSTLLVPEWMSDIHWLILSMVFWALTVRSFHLYAISADITGFLHGIAASSLAVIATCFYLIQSRLFDIDLVLLFILERAFWWPLVFSVAVLVDQHAADLNGHRSVLARIDRWLAGGRIMHTIQGEPVVTAASIASLIQAIIVFARLMGWMPMTDEQFTALMAIVVIALPIAGALIARRYVTPLSAPKAADGAPLVRQQDVRG